MKESPARHWREIPQRYRLEASKCKKCGKILFPPRLVCDECGNREFENIKLKGEGKIFSWTVIRVPPSEFKDQAPYAVGIIELAEGVKLTCQIVDCEFDEIEIGEKVRIEFRKVSEDGKSGVIYYGYKAVMVR